METINLKTQIKELLDTSGVDSYEYTRVPKTATFPYITYNLQTSTESLRDSITDVDLTLEIDILDYKEDKNTDDIENLTDLVDSIINRTDIIQPTFYFRIERLNILTQLPTTDEYTFRRQIVALLKYMERS